MNTPVLLICGPANSGKDTVASIIARKYNGVCVAQADPMKRFAREVFRFTDDQLWGPSESRNAPDVRVFDPGLWIECHGRMLDYCHAWLRELLPNITSEELKKASGGLNDWFNDIRHYFSMQIIRVDGSRWNRPTARYALQTIGTEFGRNFSKNIWIDYAMRIARALLSGGHEYKRIYGLEKKEVEPAPSYVLITDGRFRNELTAVSEANGTTIRVEPVHTGAGTIDTAGVAGHRSEKELIGIPRHFYQYILHNDKSKGLGALESMIDVLMKDLALPTKNIWVNDGGFVDIGWR